MLGAKQLINSFKNITNFQTISYSYTKIDFFV